MKRALLFPLLLMALSGCDDFYHARYRHLEKVPASGIVSRHEPLSEKSAAPLPAPPAASNDSTTVSSPLQISPAENKKQHSPRETQSLIPQKKFIPAAPQQFSSPIKNNTTAPPAAPGPGLALLLSIMLFLIGVLLIIYGISLLVIGIVFGTPLIIAFGLLCLLYGGRPVWSVVRSLFSRRRNPDPSER